MACPICNGEQRIPLKREDGSIVAFAYVNCTCKEDDPVAYYETKPEDFDFPCSGTFRGYYQEQYGHPNDRMVERELAQRPTEPQPVEVPVSQPWDKRQKYQIDQTRAELVHLKIKLAEFTGQKQANPKQPQPQQRKSTYQGLVVTSE